MKKYIFFIFILLLNSTLFCQWSEEISLPFIVQTNSQLNAFVDFHGVHVVYWRNGGIKYALVKPDGTVLKYDKVIEPEGANCDYVKIVSINNNYLYAVYKKNNTINIARSTNLGNNWTNNYSHFEIASGCDTIVAYNDNTYIRIAYTQGSEYDKDCYYIKYQSSDNQWVDNYNVTQNEYGSSKNPDIAISDNKIHYTYLVDMGTPKSRDKIKDGDWENTLSIPFLGSWVEYLKPVIANSKVNAAIQKIWITINHVSFNITSSDRTFNQGSWNYPLWSRGTVEGKITKAVSTVDNKIHYIYTDFLSNVEEHRYYDGSTLSDPIANINLPPFSATLLANSNDLYLLGLGADNVPSNIIMRHYDAAPAPPTGLTVTRSANNHPYLTWNANSEPDISYYKIEKCNNCNPGYWWQIYQTSNTHYEDQSENYCTAPPPQVCIGGCSVSYRVKAVDIQSHISDPSTSVIANVIGHPPFKTAGNNGLTIPKENSLSQNYPNPFNPTTQIDFAVKTDGFVTLKVYNMLGQEIATLVNEQKPAGSYNVTFNASNLPSGIYICSMKVNDFVQNRKVILMK